MSRMYAQHRGLLIAALVGLALVVFVVMDTRPTSEPPDALPFVDLELDHPISVAAGESFAVTVGGFATDRPVSITLDAGYGPRTFSTVSENGEAQLTIPADAGSGAGLVVIEASAGNRRAVSTMKVLPGPATSPIDLYLGPRTVEVGTDDVSMVVAVPTDAFGNPVADNTVVTYAHTRPDGETNELASSTSGLLSFIDVPSGTLAGRNVVSARAGDAQGPERTFTEVASQAADFSIEVDGLIPVANGRDLVTLTSSVVLDQYGNALPDGTFAQLEVSGVTGSRLISASSIDSQLRFTVEAPNQPGAALFTAYTSGGESNPLEINFPSAIASLPVEVDERTETSLIRVGPVLEPDGAFVPDGTPVRIIADGNTYLVELEFGEVSIVTPIASAVDVVVLGKSARVRENSDG